MNFAQLNYVLAVAQSGNFTVAARHCHVTQPTLSNSIAQLEDEFQTRIFSRTTRRVGLTPFGQHILPFIERLIEANCNLVNESKKFNTHQASVIRIGKSPLMSCQYLSAVMNDFSSHYPDTEIVLSERNSCDLTQLLEQGEVDYIFDVASEKKPTRAAEFLYEEPLYFLPSTAKPIRNVNVVHFSDIADEVFVMVDDECGLTKFVRQMFDNHNHILKEYTGKTVSYRELENWAHCGLGAALLPRSALISKKGQRYVLCDSDERPIQLRYEAVWKKNISPTVGKLKNFLKQ
ncbi:LysR family transcriptional regulator [uncultured Bartonella sp.]|uniref:LysR family transcriptional regulator n=1 Tax=uncultured Bartonella sp. TaxID=104108 RepID=UPI0025F648CC|nr:LysR family transcriptional regulator [uncultured Bartonella sp.]